MASHAHASLQYATLAISRNSRVWSGELESFRSDCTKGNPLRPRSSGQGKFGIKSMFLFRLSMNVPVYGNRQVSCDLYMWIVLKSDHVSGKVHRQSVLHKDTIRIHVHICQWHRTSRGKIDSALIRLTSFLELCRASTGEWLFVWKFY